MLPGVVLREDVSTACVSPSCHTFGANAARKTCTPLTADMHEQKQCFPQGSSTSHTQTKQEETVTEAQIPPGRALCLRSTRQVGPIHLPANAAEQKKLSPNNVSRMWGVRRCCSIVLPTQIGTSRAFRVPGRCLIHLTTQNKKAPAPAAPRHSARWGIFLRYHMNEAPPGVRLGACPGCEWFRQRPSLRSIRWRTEAPNLTPGLQKSRGICFIAFQCDRTLNPNLPLFLPRYYSLTLPSPGVSIAPFLEPSWGLPLFGLLPAVCSAPLSSNGSWRSVELNLTELAATQHKRYGHLQS
jgi:hypothetical protein